MIDKAEQGLYTVKIFTIGIDPPDKHFKRTQAKRMHRFIRRKLLEPSTIYIDIIPSEYHSTKMSWEAQKGAYDYQKAKALLTSK